MPLETESNNDEQSMYKLHVKHSSTWDSDKDSDLSVACHKTSRGIHWNNLPIIRPWMTAPQESTTTEHTVWRMNRLIMMTKKLEASLKGPDFCMGRWCLKYSVHSILSLFPAFCLLINWRGIRMGPWGGFTLAISHLREATRCCSAQHTHCPGTKVEQASKLGRSEYLQWDCQLFARCVQSEIYIVAETDADMRWFIINTCLTVFLLKDCGSRSATLSVQIWDGKERYITWPTSSGSLINQSTTWLAPYRSTLSSLRER